MPTPTRKTPYTHDEKRVCDYLMEITDGAIGCGDDPVGFLIASHQQISYERRLLRRMLEGGSTAEAIIRAMDSGTIDQRFLKDIG